MGGGEEGGGVGGGGGREEGEEKREEGKREVEEVHPYLVDEYVLWLEITVENPVMVAEAETLQQLTVEGLEEERVIVTDGQAWTQ